MRNLITLVLIPLFSSMALAQTQLVSKRVEADLRKLDLSASYWDGAPSDRVSLMAQPMIPPKPAKTNTSAVSVQSVHNSEWVAFRLTWEDTEASEAGRLGQFSDAVAIEFPSKDGDVPPVFMGGKGSPVFLAHWRAQYQRDEERGKPTIRDLYPNAHVDMYPMEFADHGKLPKISDEAREAYSPAKAIGNPQAAPKKAVDEVLAEGFGTSEVQANSETLGKGRWEEGRWVVVIARPLVRKGLSIIDPSKGTNVAFAVWQGGTGEVGSRKSVTMTWTPVVFQNSSGGSK